jgi:succinylglutamate desuccinylase
VRTTNRNGKYAGSVSVIMAGVHGNEPCGIRAMVEVLSQTQIEYGTVHFIVGNPRASNKKIRFTEMDLNRAFRRDLCYKEKSAYERARAEHLKHYLDGASALLDIHSSGTPNSRPFVICEENALPIARMLPVEIMVSGFDAVCPGGTDEYMNRQGKIGICIECGQNEDPQAITRAKEAILAFLEVRGHISERPQSKVSELNRRVKINMIYITRTNFVLAKAWPDFGYVNYGDLIGHDGGFPVYSERDGVILFPDNCNTADEEAFYFGHDI